MERQTGVLTIIDTIFPRSNLLVSVALVVGFNWFTALCAQIAFYVGAVPITGQTLAYPLRLWGGAALSRALPLHPRRSAQDNNRRRSPASGLEAVAPTQIKAF